MSGVIGPEGRRLLEAHRAEHSPPDDALARGLAALPARLAEPDLDLDADPEPLLEVPPATVGWVAKSVVLTAALAAAGLGAAYLGTTLARQGERTHIPSQAVSVPEPTAGGVALDPAPERAVRVDAPPAEVAPEPVPDVVPDPEPASRRRAPSTPRLDALAAEVRLIGQAKAERDPQRVLELLDRHARTFPSGALREEAWLLRADALCRAGRIAEARASVTAFLRTHPASSLAPRMASICAREEGAEK